MNREQTIAYQHGRLFTVNMIAILDLKRLLQRLEEGYYDNCQTLLHDQVRFIKQRLESVHTDN